KQKEVADTRKHKKKKKVTLYTAKVEDLELVFKIISPSGPVQEDTNVTLTCSANANPAVKNYTWYRADGGQETFMGTGRVLNIKASRERGLFFCKAENELGSFQSNTRQIDVHLLKTLNYIDAPQIMSSSDCTKTANQVNCSCESTGNPPPTLQWSLDGLAVNHSEEFAVSYEHRSGTGVSFITMSQAQRKDHFTVLCRSSNYLGSASQRFIFYSLPTSAESQGLSLN
uniref:Ig-like domain-containing protein n=1 Tax=Labrus bergylta TaxID=56723 RepID=A0A3Q3FFT1_9LABR